MSAPYLAPLPVKSPENLPFWEGLQRREFRVPKCNRCGDWNWIPYPGCRTCLSEELVWTPVCGRGRLMTYSIVHRGPATFGSEPYVAALVELEERPRSIVVLANVVGVPHDRLRTGMELKIVYEDIPDEDVTLYRFTAP